MAKSIPGAVWQDRKHIIFGLPWRRKSASTASWT